MAGAATRMQVVYPLFFIRATQSVLASDDCVGRDALYCPGLLSCCLWC